MPFKPCTNTIHPLYNREKRITLTFPTYRELKKNIPSIFQDYTDQWGDGLTELHVFRSKRGEWGEWYEIWKPVGNGKYKIVKEGWN